MLTAPNARPSRTALTRVALLSVVLLSLAGCSTVNQWMGKDAKKVLQLPAMGAGSTQLAWQAAAGAAGNFSFTPALADNKIYLAGRSGTISVLDEEGKPITKWETGTPLTAGLGVAGDVLAVATQSGEIAAFNPATGRALWKVGISGEVLASPEVGPGVVVIRTVDGRVIALNSGDGKRRWTFNRATPSLTLRSSSGLVLTRTEVVLGIPGGKLLVLDLEAGRLLAEFVVANPKGASELERVADVAGTPYLEERQLCAAAFQGRVACFDPANGATLWAKDLSSAAGLSGDAANLYVSITEGAVAAFAKSGGASLWRNDDLKNRQLTAPLAAGKVVLIGDHLGLVHALSTETGAFVGRMATDGSAVRALVPAGKQVIAQTANGGVYVIRSL